MSQCAGSEEEAAFWTHFKQMCSSTSSAEAPGLANLVSSMPDLAPIPSCLQDHDAPAKTGMYLLDAEGPHVRVKLLMRD